MDLYLVGVIEQEFFETSEVGLGGQCVDRYSCRDKEFGGAEDIEPRKKPVDFAPPGDRVPERSDDIGSCRQQTNLCSPGDGKTVQT